MEVFWEPPGRLKGCPEHVAGLPPLCPGAGLGESSWGSRNPLLHFPPHRFKPHGLNISKSDLQEFCFVLFYLFIFAGEASGLHKPHHCSQKLIPGHLSSLPFPKQVT